MSKLYYWGWRLIAFIPFAMAILHAIGVPHPESLHFIP